MMGETGPATREWTMRHGHRPQTSERSRGKRGGTPPERPRPAEKDTPPPRPSPIHAGPGKVVLWGRHAVRAALANPDREILSLHLAGGAEAADAEILAALPPQRRARLPGPVKLDGRDLAELVPSEAVHQGFVAVVRPLPGIGIEDLADRIDAGTHGVLVVLDQVTDPHNVGAVLRSAAAFGAAGVIMQSRHAPPADGVLAKAASGALERVPIAEVTNIARALDALKARGVWCVGLSGDSEFTIDRARLDGKIALVLGAEGPGLRRLTRERCDMIVRLPTIEDFGTLNISNAAAIALYEVRRAADARRP